MKKGLVIKSTGSWYTVREETGEFLQCKIRGKIRMHGIKNTNPVAVGDIVEYEFIQADSTGVITSIDKRKNYIIRKSSNLSKQSHIIAANIDQSMIIVTLDYPKTTTEFIDRFLVTSEAYQIPAIIVFNKIDLYNESMMNELYELEKIYCDAGYRCIRSSVIKKINLDDIQNILKDKKTVIVGNSGVGKSSLINTLDKNIDLKIGMVSDYHKAGKHTTTFAQMYKFNFGGYIIDTPGIKGFGLIDLYDEEIYHFFPEIFSVAKDCKYHNCLHVKEPNCAVKEAVKEGKISNSRYNNYLSILLNEDKKYRV